MVLTLPLALRDAGAADAAPLAALLNAIIAIGGTTAHETPFSPKDFAAAFITGPSVVSCVMAEAAGDAAPIGFQGLALYPDLPAGWVDIGTFVRPGEQASGIGAALFAATCKRARAKGFRTINATIRADNQPGLRYYTKMGFVPYAVERAVPLRDGTPVDRISHRFDLG